MSDNENFKGKGKGGKTASWSDHEVLVYILSAIESTGAKVDFAKAPAPAGRNANGCTQKISKIKIAYRDEIDAIKNGEVLDKLVETAPKKAAGGRKRKPATAEDGEESPKKKGRTKKNAASEPKSDVMVKDEPEDEAEIEEEM